MSELHCHKTNNITSVHYDDSDHSAGASIHSDQTLLIATDLSFPHADIYEPRHKKTGFLHMRKQRRRSASR